MTQNYYYVKLTKADPPPKYEYKVAEVIKLEDGRYRAVTVDNLHSGEGDSVEEAIDAVA